MLRSLPLVAGAALLCGLLATGVSRLAGPRWAWIVCATTVVAVALFGASRVGTANPFSRTARLDPLLFFVMVAFLLGVPTLAAVYATASADAGATFLRTWLWSALLFLLATPVGFIAAVAVEVLWPH
jgi:hypothetical protein